MHNLKSTFSGIYAESYDQIYASLNPEDELGQAEEFCGDAIQNPTTVIDIGGGTGRFSKILSEKYQQVYLVEPSPDMTLIASSKIGNLGNIRIVNESAQRFQIPLLAGGSYLMFSVASYFSSPKIFIDAMRNIFSNLSSGSYIYFDVWGNSDSSLPMIKPSVRSFTHNNSNYQREVNAKPNSIVEHDPGFHSLEMQIAFKNISTGVNYEECHELAIISETWIRNFSLKETRIDSTKIRLNPNKPNNLEVCITLN